MRVLLLAVTLAALLAGCGGDDAGGGGLGSNSITQAQYNAIHVGEKATDVRAALGKPDSISTTDVGGLGKSEDWTYSGPNDATVVISVSQELDQTTLTPASPLVVSSKTIV